MVEGSVREAAREFGLHRDTVRKMLQYSVPPGYRRQRAPRRPKLEPYVGVIEGILEGDRVAPKKQRHTAKRIHERLRAEYGFRGGYTIVKDYVRERRRRMREMYVPLSHPPGHAQCDFGQAKAVIGGVERKIHYFVLDLPHSDGCYVKAYPAETTEAFCDGHVSAFTFLGGVPRASCTTTPGWRWRRSWETAGGSVLGCSTNWYPTTCSKTGLADPARGTTRVRWRAWWAMPAGTSWCPSLSYRSFDELNVHLQEKCLERMERRLRGHKETIGERIKRDIDALLPLPATPYEACDKHTTRVSSLSLVRYRTNDYSVPVAYGHREVLVRGYVGEVVISCGAEVIARHRRSYQRDDYVFDPIHYLLLLEQKTGALDQAAPLAGWELPEEFETFRRLLESRMGRRGKREYVQVLRLMENFRKEEVHKAVGDALKLGAISFDAIKHLLLSRIENRPARLDLTLYPHLPRVRVTKTRARDYMSLLAGGRS